MHDVMSGKDKSTRNWITAVLCSLCLASPAFAQTESDPSIQNPISRLARIVNPKLVKVEDRVNWLDQEASTLAKYRQFPLKYGLGYRGCRLSPKDEDPTIVMDLGREMPIHHIYLIPSQSEYLNDYGIFPLRFTIEVSKTPDFKQAELVYRTANNAYPQTSGAPAGFASKFSARYIRISVQEGHQKGAIDLFGFAELIAISNGEPVSFNASITTTGSLNTPGLWYPEALIDGRTPLGIWHHGYRQDNSIGDAVLVDQAAPLQTTWKCNLPSPGTINRIILFPYQVNRSYELSYFPDSLRIEIYGQSNQPPIHTIEWNNPAPGTTHLNPLVFPMQVENAQTIAVTATRPWAIGNMRMNALSEIEVWSNGKNIIRGIPCNRHSGNETVEVLSLTDDFSSEKKISPIHIWLEQLVIRGKIENELNALRSVHNDLVSRIELNVSWGSAVLLGLTFLIPVFIVEKRRMRSKEHLDIIRKRIASDLHDDIGSNLGSISLIARTARKDLARMNGPVEIDEDLGEVEIIARESSLAMRDIVWLLERKQDSIGDLAHRMRETAGRLLREVPFTMECSSTRTTSKLTLDAKRHLFLFFKEAIHNVIKHSKATRVTIRMWDEGDQLGMEILDNGIGLPVTNDRASVSVKKLEDRAELLAGILQVTSSTETGTSIRLLVKRAYLTTQPKSS